MEFDSGVHQLADGDFGQQAARVQIKAKQKDAAILTSASFEIDFVMTIKLRLGLSLIPVLRLRTYPTGTMSRRTLSPPLRTKIFRAERSEDTLFVRTQSKRAVTNESPKDKTAYSS